VERQAAIPDLPSSGAASSSALGRREIGFPSSAIYQEIQQEIHKIHWRRNENEEKKRHHSDHAKSVGKSPIVGDDWRRRQTQAEKHNRH
jgi:hypothetical protein